MPLWKEQGAAHGQDRDCSMGLRMRENALKTVSGVIGLAISVARQFGQELRLAVMPPKRRLAGVCPRC